MENAFYAIISVFFACIVVYLVNPLEKLLSVFSFLLHGRRGSNLPDGVKPFEDMPGPKGLPYFGCFFLYRKSSGLIPRMKLLQGFIEQYGSVFKQTVLGQTMVFISDPKAVETIIKADGRYPKRPTKNEVMRAFKRYSNSRKLPMKIVALEGEEWSRVRKALAPKMLRPKDIRENLENFTAVVRDAIDRMLAVRGTDGSDGEIPDLHRELAKWSTESLGTMAFDLRVGLYEDPPNQEIIKMIEAVTDANVHLNNLMEGWESFLFRFMDTPSFKKYCETRDVALNVARMYVEKKIADLKRNTEEFSENQAVPLLTFLISRAELTSEEITSNCVNMFAAGVETTSNSTLWLLYELSRNPRVQDKLYEEVTSLIGPHGHFTPESFAKLDYVKACVREAMRLHPILPTWGRLITQDVTLAGYHVPTGTTVEYGSYLAGRSEKPFKDPMEFKPERWLKGESEEKIHPFTVVPFGLGPRMCLGRRIAEFEMYLLTAKIIQRFTLEYHHEPVDMITRLFTVPDRPVKIKFVDRQ